MYVCMYIYIYIYIYIFTCGGILNMSLVVKCMCVCKGNRTGRHYKGQYISSYTQQVPTPFWSVDQRLS